MKKTYRLKMPKGVELQMANLTADDEYVELECTFKKKFEPKKGDFIVSNDTYIVIYSHTKESGGVVSFAGCNIVSPKEVSTKLDNGWGYTRNFDRYATEEEKEKFLNLIKERYSLRWNPEKFEFEKIRWRAKEGGKYYLILLMPNAQVSKDIDWNAPMDDKCYESGNYFRTEEEAQAVADKINKLFEDNNNKQ